MAHRWRQREESTRKLGEFRADFTYEKDPFRKLGGGGRGGDSGERIPGRLPGLLSLNPIAAHAPAPAQRTGRRRR
jgi:hypothetical protein